MKGHLNAVALIHLIAGAFFTILGVLVPLGALLFAPWFYGGPLWSPGDRGAIVAGVLSVSALTLAVGIPNLIAGSGLRQGKHWAHFLAAILAALALLAFPIGTAAGVYSLWALTRKDLGQLQGAAT